MKVTIIESDRITNTGAGMEKQINEALAQLDQKGMRITKTSYLHTDNGAIRTAIIEYESRADWV